MRRSRRPIATVALTVSLLLHAALLGGPAWHRFPATFVESPPLEARLVAMPPATQAVPQPAQSIGPRPRRDEPQPRRVPPAPVAAEAAAPASPRVPPAEPEVSAPAEVAAAEAAPVASPPPASDTVVPVQALNPLPPRLDLKYSVHYGLVSGVQTLVWVNEGARYTVTSVASATGLAGLFYRGQFVQTSRGHLTSTGLIPEEFWDRRGDRLSTARFDAGRVTWVPAKGEPRHFSHEGTVQDALSLFFQLASALPSDARIAYSVFNGKKLRDYVYEVRGEETLETALGPLRTVHLVRVGSEEGRFEAWLAPDRYSLPVRVLRSDEDGNTVELRIASIAP